VRMGEVIEALLIAALCYSIGSKSKFAGKLS
jgi:hypothetical protein